MANPKIKKQIKNAKKSGMSMIELARIKEVAKKETEFSDARLVEEKSSK